MPVPGKMCLPILEQDLTARVLAEAAGLYHKPVGLDVFLADGYTLCVDILPLPARMEPRPGAFRLTRDTVILTDPPNCWNADYLHGLLSIPTGFPLTVRPSDQVGKSVFHLRLDPGLSELGREGYRLTVAPETVLLEAPETAGVFYGLQSLRQILPVEIEQRHLVSGVDWQIACVFILDRPRFPWRSFMLDEGRHFQGRDTVLRQLDLMALQKLNIFHWHLTEDEGWRIEIKKYPRLTEIGSQRLGTRNGYTAGKHNRIPHGGFYTQEEIRQIVAFAAERHITIVPEVEMPSHSLAALAAYPELSCTGGPFVVGTHFGIYPDIYCAGKETVFTFLEAVLDEVLELFPSPFIHIGGDEAPKTRWKNCPDCQQRMRAEGLKNAQALQVYFTNRIAAYLDSRGRQALGWNEILQPGLVESAMVQYWLGGPRRIIEAVRTGHRKIVMSPCLRTYLDFPYTLLPLRRIYAFEPVPAGLDEQAAASILGLEAPLWTEWVPNRDKLDFQVFPRLAALAETGWTPKELKSLPDFRRRIPRFLARLDLLGVKHASLKAADPFLLSTRSAFYAGAS
jgi:hexosaminidase